jgi:heme-degrading monooxygenase HmoA
VILSILTRKTRLADRAKWEAALAGALPRIRELLEAEPGFAGVEYLWSTDEPGRFAQVTRWQTEDDCLRYIREGGAATVATFEEAAVPTAAHPDGAWARANFEASDL